MILPILKHLPFMRGVAFSPSQLAHEAQIKIDAYEACEAGTKYFLRLVSVR